MQSKLWLVPRTADSSPGPWVKPRSGWGGVTRWRMTGQGYLLYTEEVVSTGGGDAI